MVKFLKFLLFKSLVLSCLLIELHPLSAYVATPRSTADTTDRMNAGGDPPDRAGLKDIQRSPEYLDDFWGRNDYYYSQHGVHQTGRVESPIHDYPHPPVPNVDAVNDPALRQYDDNTRYYRPGYPR